MLLFHYLVYAFITTVVAAANVNLTEILTELPSCSVSSLETRSLYYRLTRTAPLYHRRVELLARGPFKSTDDLHEHYLTTRALSLCSNEVRLY
jgi:hypothetical protein